MNTRPAGVPAGRAARVVPVQGLCHHHAQARNAHKVGGAAHGGHVLRGRGAHGGLGLVSCNYTPRNLGHNFWATTHIRTCTTPHTHAGGVPGGCARGAGGAARPERGRLALQAGRAHARQPVRGRHDHPEVGALAVLWLGRGPVGTNMPAALETQPPGPPRGPTPSRQHTLRAAPRLCRWGLPLNSAASATLQSSQLLRQVRVVGWAARAAWVQRMVAWRAI